MTYDAWLLEVHKLSSTDFDLYCEWYSFYDAWEEGKSPKQAYEDCRDWMAA